MVGDRYKRVPFAIYEPFEAVRKLPPSPRW